MDPIADMLIQLKNAAAVKKPVVVLPASNLKTSVAKILLEEGYLKNVVKRGKKVKKSLSCEIAYGTDGESKLKNVKRISKPSCRVYKNVQELKGGKISRSIVVVSTSKGVMTADKARESKVGGEVLFQIW